MAEPIVLIKNSEKVLIWLHREGKTQQWLADQFKVTRQAVSQKIADNYFTDRDKTILTDLGCPV